MHIWQEEVGLGIKLPGYDYFAKIKPEMLLELEILAPDLF
jgi:hypothetical protein